MHRGFMRRNVLALLSIFLALPLAAQTINPNQIRPGTANGEVLTTVTANQPPSWQQVQSVLIQTNGTPNASQSTLNFSNTPSVSWSNPSGGIEQANVLVSGGFQNYTPDPLGTQSVLVPFTVATNNLDGGSPCFATSNTTSGQVGFTGGGANLGCQAPPGPTITWSAASLPSYVTPANVTAIYAVGTVGYSGNSQALNLKCSNPTPNTTTLMDGGTLDGSPDTGVLKAYSAQLAWATGANIGTISCVANVAANAGGADNPTMNISNIQLRVYYTGTAPPASTALNVTSPLYINTALNALGVSAINLAGSGDGGVIGLLPVGNGGTNGTTAAAALSNLLGNPAAGGYAINCTSTTSCTPTGATISGIDEYWTSSGCSFSADTNGQSCTLAMTIPGGGFADTSYTVFCTPYLNNSTNNSFGYAMVKNGTKTTTGFSLLLVEDWGNSAGAGNSWPEVDCHAHHN
jgi:hypothetical protein